MKRIFALVLAVIVVVSLLAACGGKKKSSSKKFDGLAVGVGRADITPDDPIGIHLSGGGDPNRLAEGLLDEFVVTCVAITDEENNTVLFLHQDLQGVDAAAYGNASRQAMSEATGVPVDNIYIAATHTHSGPYPNDATTPQNVEWTVKYNRAVVEAAKAAMKDRASATMQAGTMDAKAENNGQAMAFVRHYLHKDGTVAGSNFGKYNQALMCGFPYEADNEAQLIKFTREGKNDVLMMNWPAHSTFHGTTTKKNLSADYPYYLRTYIEENTGATCAVFLGGAGDQTPQAELYPVANHGLNCEQYGAKLGELIVNFMAKDGNMKEVDGSGAIKQDSVMLTVDTNKIPAEMSELAAQAEEVYQYFLENGQEKGTSYAISKGFQSCYEARAFVNRLQLPDTKDITIDVLCLGDMSFAIAPYEISSTSALEIKHSIADSGVFDMAFVVGYCNDVYGYIPAISNFEYNNNRSSYEAYACSFAKGTCELLTETYIQMITNLKAE